MPIYEYHCEECHAEFEALLLSKADQMSVACSRCGSEKVTKLLSGAAIVSSVGGDTWPCGASGECGGGSCGMGGCGDYCGDDD